MDRYKRIYIIAIAAIMFLLTAICAAVFCVFSGTAKAEGNVAEVTVDGGSATPYTSVKDAFVAANGASGANVTIKLLADCETTESLNVASGKSITLDLNDKVLTYNNSATKGSVIVVEGTFTLNDLAYPKTQREITIDNTLYSTPKRPFKYTVEGGMVTGGTGTLAGTYYVGGGVLVKENATFEMYGGNIADNTAQYGGGIRVNENATFRMSNQSCIVNNKAEVDGGGLCVYSAAEINMQGQSQIVYNSASCGGGIYFEGNDTVTSAYSVQNEVGYNCANLDWSSYGDTDGKRGGGIYVDHCQVTVGSSFGGNVHANIADIQGGGVYVKSNGTVKVSGSAEIGKLIGGNNWDNSNVYNGIGTDTYFLKRSGVHLSEGAKIEIDSSFSGKVGISVDTLPTTGEKILAAGWADSFKDIVYADDRNYTIKGSSGNIVLVKSPAATVTVRSDPYSDGTTTEYQTVKEAFDAANNATGTTEENPADIKLMSDCEVSETMTVNAGKYIKLNLNAHSLTYNNASVKGSVIAVEGSLTLHDYSELGAPDEPTRTFTSESGSKATYRGGIIIGGTGTNIGTDKENLVGGGVYVKGNGYFDQNALIAGNTATNGGGVYVSSGATYKLNSTLAFNKAAENGGGIYVAGAKKIWLTGGGVERNSASCGGGIAFEGKSADSFNFVSVPVDYNSATRYGGGIYMKDCEVTLGDDGNYGRVFANTAVTQGGGVYVGVGGQFNVSGGAIVGPFEYGGGRGTTENQIGSDKNNMTVNNVYLSSGTSIGFKDVLREGSSEYYECQGFTGKVKVTTEVFPTTGSPVTVATGWQETFTGTITSDIADFTDSKADGNVILSGEYTGGGSSGGDQSGDDQTGGDSSDDQTGGGSSDDQTGGGSSDDQTGGGSSDDQTGGGSSDDQTGGGSTDDQTSGGSTGDQTTGGDSTGEQTENDGLSGGQIAAIAIASSVGFLILLYVVGMLLYKFNIINFGFCKVIYRFIKK